RCAALQRVAAAATLGRNAAANSVPTPDAAQKLRRSWVMSTHPEPNENGISFRRARRGRPGHRLVDAGCRPQVPHPGEWSGRVGLAGLDERGEPPACTHAKKLIDVSLLQARLDFLKAPSNRNGYRAACSGRRRIALSSNLALVASRFRSIAAWSRSRGAECRV